MKRYPTVTLVNGRLVDDRKPQVSVFDNALLYAEGLFETCLGVDDRVLFLKEHLDRLFRGAKVTGLQVPHDRPTLSRWLHRAGRLHPSRVTQIRLTVTPGESPRWRGVPGKPQVIISAARYRMRRDPYTLFIADTRVDQFSEFRRIKTVSYAINAAALKQAQRRGCDDAILLNEAGEVAETTSSNIFVVRKQQVITPPLTAGCLDGVTRRKIIRLGRRIGYPVIEKRITLNTLLTADEVFISSSLKLIAPVSLIMQGRRKYRFATGEVTASFRDGLWNLLRLPADLR